MRRPCAAGNSTVYRESFFEQGRGAVSPLVGWPVGRDVVQVDDSAAISLPAEEDERFSCQPFALFRLAMIQRHRRQMVSERPQPGFIFGRGQVADSL